MAPAALNSAPAGGADISAALRAFLASDAVEGGSAAEEGSGGLGELALGELDISSSSANSLAGLEEALDHFSEHPVLKAILDQGCDPAEYGKQYEAQLRQAELESIEDYLGEAHNLVTLHEQMSTCDEELAGMEDMLGRFQGDLAAIGHQIRSLQEQSAAMSVRLKNRQAAEGRLAGFLDSLALSPALIRTILQGEVNDVFLHSLGELHQKLDFLSQSSMAQSSAAAADVMPELERLRVKAAAKARDHLMANIYALRRPKTNIQILQQSLLLKYRGLLPFLRAHGPEVFGEVRAAYVETLSRVLSSHFKAYLTSLDALKAAGPLVTDLLGSAEVPAAGMLGMFSRGGADSKAEAWGLAERAQLLLHLDSAALIPHVLASQGHKLPIEVLFRSVNKLLMDTATSEYLFCADFFAEDAVFQELFGASLQAVEAHLAASVQETHDMIGLLLMIRINYQHRLIMSNRRIPCLDGYLDRVNLALWPRFKVVFDAQLVSVKEYRVAGGGAPRLELLPLTQRYAALTTSLLLLNADYEDGQLEHNIGRMRYVTMDLLIKLSRTFQQKRLAVIFLVVNLNHVSQALREAAMRGMHGGSGERRPAATLGPIGEETLKEFEDQLATCSSMYVEEVLAVHFGELLSYVKKAEHAAAACAPPEGQLPPGFGVVAAEPVIRDFAARWTTAIEALHREVTKDFSKSVCGREVVKSAMTQLLLYYTRALELLKGAGPEGLALVRDAVTVPSIMYEIKRKTPRD